MRTIAAEVRDLRRAGEAVAIARVIEIEGFGSRRAGEALAIHASGLIGGILSGTADDQLRDVARELRGATALRVDIADPAAVDAGLACGGTAVVLVQDAALIPDQLWTEIIERRPVAVATDLATGRSMAVFDGQAVGTLDDRARDAVAVGLAVEQMTKGRSGTRVDDGIVVEAVLPIPHLLVLGVAELAHALRRQGALLGWTVDVSDERIAGVTGAAVDEAERAGRQDAVVVLSHDLEASTAVLAAGLRSGCYVGALGSRGTQAKRAEILTSAHGLSAEAIAQVHGPVGLDIGARSPEETAIAIFAEIVAHRSGRSAAPLRGSAGPING